MSNITYLLGAGASAGNANRIDENVLPTVATMVESIKKQIGFLEKNQTKSYTAAYVHQQMPAEIRDKDIQATLQNIINTLYQLLDEAGNYHTIDTLAKKYYLTKKQDGWDKLIVLKKALIIYFTIEQFVFRRFDKRYDSFIATIANNNGEDLVLNKSIKVLSWNYDLQLEISLKKFLGTDINHAKEVYNIFPNNTSVLINEIKQLVPKDQFGMIKLNGNAIWELLYEGNSRKTIFDVNEPSKLDTPEKLLAYFLNEFNRFSWKSYHLQSKQTTEDEHIGYFNFAWEKDQNFEGKYIGHSNNLAASFDIARLTNILVVIGYSFPIFNREVDKSIMSCMNNLKKVYIQDKDPERIMSTMKNVFNFSSDVKFILETSLNQFVIPFELI